LQFEILIRVVHTGDDNNDDDAGVDIFSVNVRIVANNNPCSNDNSVGKLMDVWDFIPAGMRGSSSCHDQNGFGPHLVGFVGF
jgi:hypothetical protein